MKGNQTALLAIVADTLEITTTDGIERFDCGTLLNTNPDKLAIINLDVKTWWATIERWRQTSGWISGMKGRRNYHPLYTGLRASAVASRRFETMAQAENMDMIRHGLNALMQAFADTERGRGSNRWIVGDLAAKGMALAPYLPPSRISWQSKYFLVHDDHPWVGLMSQQQKYNKRARFLLNSTILPNNGQICEAFVEALVNYSKEWDSTMKSAVASLLRELCNEARSRDPSWKSPDVHKSRLWDRRKVIHDPNAWYITDPEYGDPRFTIWQEDAAAWLGSLTHAKLSKHSAALRTLMAWNRDHPTPLLATSDLERHHIKRSVQTPENFLTFLEYQDQSDLVVGRKSADIFHLGAFFDWWRDSRGLDLGLDPNHANPFHEKDLERHPVPTKGNKSNKRVLPREILTVAKEINKENDYAFARSLDLCHAHVFNPDIGDWENRFCPVLPTAMDTMLTLPIRTVQTMLLDSGEADEQIFDTQVGFVENVYPLAHKRRRCGVIREITTALGPPVLGFFINTNKTELRGDGQAERGYEIPWHEKYLIGRLAELAAWQRKFNPLLSADDLLSRDQLRGQKYRHEGKVSGLSRHAYLMRAPNDSQPMPSDLLSKYWALLLQEVERRLRDKNVETNLVEELSNKKLRAIYTLHGLRVAGITAFVEAGLPLHVIAEFVSGHATLLMVLHYTVSSPEKIHAAIEDAARTNRELEENMRPLLERLRLDASEEDLGPLASHFFGSERAMGELVTHPVDLQEIMPDGICPVGGTMCHTAITGESNSRKDGEFAPLQRDQYNCVLCRFRVTGPAFLQGQVTVFNNLLYRIWAEAQCLDGILREKKTVGEGQRVQFHLQKRENAISDRLDHLFKLLAARMSEILQSKALLDEPKTPGAEEKHSLVTRMLDAEVEIAIESDAHHWDLIEFAARTAEIFPAVAERDISIRKARFLSRMFKNNGVGDLLLQLSDDEALCAGNRFTALLQERIRDHHGTDGRHEMRSLMDCTTTLEELGVAGDFEEVVGEVRKMLPRALELAALPGSAHG